MTVVAETKRGVVPEDVKQAADAVWQKLASGLIGFTDMRQVETEIIACAILAERNAAEARMGELLKDPVAVRLNWQRGGINADGIIAEVRERCAEVADVAADEQDVLAMSAGERSFAIYRQGERVAKSIASSIRSGAKP